MENKVRDSVHGFIYFTNMEKEIIDYPEFQRLRYIRQLALTSYVYPGAVHTRFEHSLGVMEVASRMFDKLCSKKKEKEFIEKNFKGINLNIDDARQVLRLAGLLHDIGHLPFSHGGEAILPRGKKHEDISISVIECLKPKIDTIFFEGITDLIIQLIQKEVVLKELNLLKNIISGSIDADRTDYLIRDSHHCGVDYGYFDYNRLIESLTIVSGIDGGLDLAIEHGGIHALEALILARYYMFTQVYYHRTRRIYDHYLKGYMESWKKKLKNFVDVTKYDDVSLVQELRNVAENISNKYSDFAYRICNRRHHSMIFQTSEFANLDARIKAEKIYKQMSNTYCEYDFIIDNPTKGTKIHEFYVEDRDSGDEVGKKFFVVRNNKRFLLTKESHIIKEMPTKFHMARIYVDSKDKTKLNNTVISQLREKALELEMTMEDR